MKLKKHYMPRKYKDPIMKEIYNGYIKFNIIMNIYGCKYSTSITLKKNIVALWIVMMDKVHTDHNRVIIEFIENVCLKRWKGDTAKGLGDFVLKCMIHSFLERKDYEDFKNVYMSLNGRAHNPKKAISLKDDKVKGYIRKEIL